MDIKHKFFPYPVLAQFNDDYKKYNFFCDMSMKQKDKKLIFDFKVNINNNDLQTLIRNEKATYVFHIECSSTSFRQAFYSHTGEERICIDESRINGKLEIVILIISKEKIYAYRNNDFNDDFKNEIFRIEKGCILAIGEQYNLWIYKEIEGDGKKPSIFSIMKNLKAKENEMEIKLNDNKVLISLPETTFNAYKKIAKNSALEAVFHSMIVLPTLVFIIDEMKRNGTEEYEEYRWYKVIEKTLEKENISLDSRASLEKEPSISIAQKILNMPVTRAIDRLAITNNIEDEE